MELSTVELCSGIGGFRRGLEQSGWRTLYANDWEESQFRWEANEDGGIEKRGSRNKCGEVYRGHWNDGTYLDQDIKTVEPSRLPDHLLLTAGFPCPSFSTAGNRKGFQDPRGTIFFHILQVIEAKKPPLVLLENVRGLLFNDRGQTFATILQSLGDIGYWVEWQLLNCRYFGLAQSRPRVFIIGHLRDGGTREVFPLREGDGIPPQELGGGPRIASCLDPHYYKGSRRQRTFIVDVYNHSLREDQQVSGALKSRGTSSTSLGTAVAIGTKNPHEREESRIWSPIETARSISGHNGNHKIFVKTLVDGGYRIRKLTPTEFERLQGFPDGWTARGLTADGIETEISDTQRWSLLGNAVPVPVVADLGLELKKCLN